MTSRYDDLQNVLTAQPRRWLVTGAAGFIGANLCEKLLALGQSVVGLDNFMTGKTENVKALNAMQSSGEFTFINGDIRDLDTCMAAVTGIDHVLHQAALGSVPRSVADPLTTNDVNISGFLTMLRAAQQAGVQSFVYAASSSTYGDSDALPKIEDRIGNPLSPYAVTKRVNEIYADVFQRTYGFRATGLRYFNVFGRRQDPDSTYAAVIPQWVGRMLQAQPTWINGDGETSRDFCYIDNVIQANLLAADASRDDQGLVYNVGVGDRTTLATLHELLRDGLTERGYGPVAHAELRPLRAGDVRHSQASIERASKRLGYRPTHDIRAGLREALDWYVEDSRRRFGNN